MSNHAVQAPAKAAGPLDAALARWSADPRLAALVAAPGALLLVLDGEGGRILHASERADALRAAVADASGRLHASPGLGSQIRRLGPLSERPRIARLRFDARGIAPAVACHVARAPLEDEATALLVMPLTLPRVARSARTAAQPEEAPSAVPESPAAAAAADDVEPPRSNRLVWRSDGQGVLTHVSGAGADMLSELRGRSWASLCAEAADDRADALLAALREKRTFRALPLGVRVRATASETVLDVSGAPSGRANGVFTGFAGFALVRERGPSAEATAVAEPDTAADGATDEARPNDEAPTETVAVEHPDEAPDARPNGADRAGAPAPVSDPETERTSSTERAAVRAAPDLSTDEHAAFREIARALGARFAGDGPRPSASRDAAPPSPGQAEPLPAPVRADTSEAVGAAFERLPVGILVHRQQAVLFANRRLLDLTDAADPEGLGRIGAVSDLLREPAAEEAADGIEEIAVPADGTGAAVRLLVERSSLDWNGEPAGLLLLRPAPRPEPVRDNAESEPAAGRERDAQALLDGLDDGVVTLDADGHVLRLNPRAETILAEAAPRIVGKRFASLFGPDGATAIAADLSPAQEARGRGAAAVTARLSEASATPLRVRIGRLLSTDESPLYATLQDMAEAKRVEDEAAARRGAEDAARRKFAFFAKAGQEVRAPLRGIVGVADAMLAEPFGPLGSERYREDLRDVRASGGQALGLLDDLVELAEIEAGRIDLAFADLPLNDLVSRCIAELQPQAARRRIVLRTSLADDLRPLHADERSMRHAAIKVLANAIRLTEAGGQVIVSTTLAEAGDVALRVRDTGSGMSPEEVDHALDPFRQPRMPGAPSESGTGLGLTLTKALVEANHGRLRVTSRKDEGTLVEMLFSPKAANA